MKIASETQSRLALRHGAGMERAIGIVCAALGVALWIFNRAMPDVFWIGLALVVFGAVRGLRARTVTIVIDKTSRQISVETRRGGRMERSRFSLGDVDRIESRRQWTMTTVRAPSAEIRLAAHSCIVLRDGREIPLDYGRDSSSMAQHFGGRLGPAGAVPRAVYVARFLGVPFRELSPRQGAEDG